MHFSFQFTLEAIAAAILVYFGHLTRDQSMAQLSVNPTFQRFLTSVEWLRAGGAGRDWRSPANQIFRRKRFALLGWPLLFWKLFSKFSKFVSQFVAMLRLGASPVRGVELKAICDPLCCFEILTQHDHIIFFLSQYLNFKDSKIFQSYLVLSLFDEVWQFTWSQRSWMEPLGNVGAIFCYNIWAIYLCWKGRWSLTRNCFLNGIAETRRHHQDSCFTSWPRPPPDRAMPQRSESFQNLRAHSNRLMRYEWFSSKCSWCGHDLHSTRRVETKVPKRCSKCPLVANKLGGQTWFWLSSLPGNDVVYFFIPKKCHVMMSYDSSMEFSMGSLWILCSMAIFACLMCFW